MTCFAMGSVPSWIRHTPPLPPFPLSDPSGGGDSCIGGESVRTRGVDRPTTREAVGKVPVHLYSPDCWLEGQDPVTLGSLRNLLVVRMLEVILKTKLVSTVDMHLLELEFLRTLPV